MPNTRERSWMLIPGRPLLHIEVFLPRYLIPNLMSGWKPVYPAISGISALNGLITVMVQQGYEYQRDDSLGLWSSADMKYSITYDM
jgi:hypothetical protein